MKYKGRYIDHIVYCVPNLEEAIEDIAEKLGCRPQTGGRHVNNGTKNALLNLSHECYFEILAIDEENKKFGGARWMGMDLIDKPTITRWAMKSKDLQMEKSILGAYKPGLGQESEGERIIDEDTILNWKMLLPQAGPKIELAPFMLDWSDSEQHPTAMLENKCTLESISFKKAKNNKAIQSCFDGLFPNFTFEEAEEDQISICIKGPSGTLHL